MDDPGKPEGIPAVIKPGEEHATAAQQQKKGCGLTKIAALLYVPPAKKQRGRQDRQPHRPATAAIKLAKAVGADHQLFSKGSKEAEIKNIRPRKLSHMMRQRQTEEKWHGGQEPEQQSFPETAIEPEFGKGRFEVLSQ